MKKFILNCLSLMIVFALNSTASFATEKLYKFVPVNDKKTRVEFARTIVPDNFEVSTDVVWSRDFENPALITITAKPKDKDVFFFASTQKTFVDTSNLKKNYQNKKDPKLNISNKKFVTPEEYILEIVNVTNPNATDVKLLSEKSCSSELKEYLIGELYKKAENTKDNYKTDRHSASVKLEKPFIEPYIATYTFNVNGKQYKQTFLTMFSSIDLKYVQKSSYDEYSTITKKLWTNSGVYSFRAEEKDYNNYIDDFVIFVSDTMMNQKAKYALNQVKIQMAVEQNPSFVDVHTGIPLKNLPSELFRRYYEGGSSDYSENQPMQQPSINDLRWVSEILAPQTCYGYRKISSVWNQKLYVPEKYQNVYYNTLQQKLLINDNGSKPDGIWIKLKPSKINYNIKNN